MPKIKSVVRFVFQFYEPFILGFALYILFIHIQDITRTASPYTLGGLWGAFMTDVSRYPMTVWFFLFVAFVVWGLVRWLITRWNRQEDKARDDVLRELIENNTKAMRELTTTINNYFRREDEDGDL
ncbi:MAG: hypothetical protein ABIB93_01605 [Chloroflexota bacterium]